MFWCLSMYNKIFIYNIIYVLIHILCYVVFITKMFEIKQNELIRIYTYNLRSIQVRGRHPQPYFLSRQANFLIKNILHFWTICNFQKPL